MSRDDVEVRTVTAAEGRDWLRALATGFLQPPVVEESEAADRLAHMDLGRVRGGFAGDGRCVATYRSFSQQLTVVGGAFVTANAVAQVTVAPTHRRRGILTRMITDDLAAAKERGDTAATLLPAEYAIYGRFGFGPATSCTEWEIDVTRSGLDPRRSGPADGGRVDLADAEDVRKVGPELHERFRARQHGAIDRDERWWSLHTGAVRLPSQPWTEPYHAVYRSAAGEVEGLITYTAESHWTDGGQPADTARVQSLIAVSPAAERALWQFVCSIDWITRVRSGGRAPDDLLPLLLPDPRAARTVSHTDFLWVRLLDVVRALQSRTYEASGSLVLDVRDEAGLAGGRFRLDATPEGAWCVPTTEEPDLVMGAGELGRLYLGDESVLRLVALGCLDEERQGAAARADGVFRARRRPWCPDMF
ncbi:GNAT family N-acetyltransferase [Streptomyces sp. FIT100]|uniref:GNAT family N-acetyltransferase n=1 Tax=Streptomyces sp. FIT100 TaxID=2837956 RepID=UPI0021C9F4A9|nr:GNAT family N-acetyltransferase [Streptomyces sp. FIT100]UUN27714.1 GNAT family N-acetyltransferase [Streptomyces sp. FIT100]